MPVIHHDPKTQEEKDTESRAKAKIEIEEQAKMMSFCKDHERYFGGSDCIDCIRKSPTIKEREQMQQELLEKLWPKTEEDIK